MATGDFQYFCSICNKVYYYMSSCPTHGLVPYLTPPTWPNGRSIKEEYEKDWDKTQTIKDLTEQLANKKMNNYSQTSIFKHLQSSVLLINQLKSALYRDWKDETPEQIIAIAINGLYYRNKEIKELKDKLDDWEGSVKWVMDESCDANTKHCSCVPTLRKMVKELKEELVAAKELLKIERRSNEQYHNQLKEIGNIIK